jgi:hypothetical protein
VIVPAGPEEGGGSKRRIIAIAIAVIVVLIGAAAAVIITSGGSSGPEFKASTSVKLTAGKTTLEKVEFLNPPDTFPTDVRNQILSSVGTYVDDAIVKPLRAGAADDTALAGVFDPAAVARLTAGDRSILLDEGLPKALGKIAVTTPPVAMSALVDASGKIQLVTATVDLKVTAQAKQGIVKIERSGTLVFVLDTTGSWKITGWTIHVDRTGPGITLPTTTAPAPDTTVVTT